MDNAEEFVMPNNLQFVGLSCSHAFGGLTLKEKLYAHYFSQACWYGSLISFVQTSPEAPLVFSLLHRIFLAESASEFKQRLLKIGITEEEIQAFMIYACALFSYYGNYKMLGDFKILPNLHKESFEKIVKASRAFSTHGAIVQRLWDRIGDSVYSATEREKSLGLNGRGITKFFSSNCTIEDAEFVGEWMMKRGHQSYITRAFKYSDHEGRTVYEIKLASVLKEDADGITFPEEEYKNAVFKITRGDYSKLLKLMMFYLNEAIVYASNDKQKGIIQKYLNSFERGSLQDHKDATKVWLSDKNPIVETNVGFLETYRDPVGQRGAFVGFVAMVNKETQSKFNKLIENAQEYLLRLPWGKHFDKESFMSPDFTSLELLTYAGIEVPGGVNLPRYTDIMNTDGFKNISFSNVITNIIAASEIKFLSKDDTELLTKYRVKSFEIQVGLHELLGHGSGKLFRRDEQGQYNFDPKQVKNPLTSKPIDSWYEPGETYETKFSVIGLALEECRAEAVGLYLCLNKDIMKIFGYDGKVADDIVYVIWLNLIWSAIVKGIEMYSPEKKTWMQGHSQARFVIMSMLLELGDGLIDIKETRQDAELLVTLDRAKIHTVGKKELSNLLLLLQVFKSTGDVKSARELFARYSEVSETGKWPFGRWRRIITSSKSPRKIFVQCNTYPTLNKDDVVLKTYEPSATGCIQSWVDRFPNTTIDDILEEMWEEDSAYFQ